MSTVMSDDKIVEAAVMKRVFWRLLIGWIKTSTGSFPLAIMPIAALAFAGTIGVLVIGRNQPRTAAVTSS